MMSKVLLVTPVRLKGAVSFSVSLKIPSPLSAESERGFLPWFILSDRSMGESGTGRSGKSGRVR